MNEILVHSRGGAETFLSAVPWAAIQITGRPGDCPCLSAVNRVAQLQLCFPDRALPD
jgi:hypothetical protein